IEVLPYEGAYEGRVLYRAVKLILAMNALEEGRLTDAAQFIEESKRWPENLGVGKPYDSQINTEWEDSISAWIAAARSGDSISNMDIKKLKNQVMQRFLRF